MKLFSFFSGEGWESERDRFKQIIEDRDSQITQLKIEGDVGRSQLGGTKKEIDELKNKLQDYEKMSKFQKAAVSDTSATAELETKLADTKKQLSNFERYLLDVFWSQLSSLIQTIYCSGNHGVSS